MPTSSSSVIGPTGKPKSTSALSIASIERAFVEQPSRLVHVRRERARRVEAGPVVHDDDRLAEPLAVGHGA